MRKLILPCIVVLAVIISACGGGPVQYMERGDRLFRSGQYAEAEINYRKAVQKDPRLGDAFYKLGQLQSHEGRPEEAYRSLVSAVGLLPERHDIAVSLADASFAAYLRNPKYSVYYDQVSASSSRFLREDPKSFDGLRLKGFVAMFDRHFPEAIELLKAADAIKPMQQDVVFALVQCLIQAHRGPEGEALGEALVQRDKTFGPIYEVLYRYYSGGNRLADAEAILKAKVANNPENPEYRLELASHYAATGNEAEMKQTVQALEDRNRFPDSALQIGDFYAALNRWDDAIQEYRAGASKYPKSKLVYEKRIARVLISQGKRDQALNLIDGILTENRNDYDARMMRASINVDSGDSRKLNSGEAELQALSQEKPADAIVRLNLGKARLLAGDARGALAQLIEALRLDPELSEARLLAAETSVQVRDYQAALQYAGQVLEATPQSPVARLIRVRSLAGLGSVGQAIAEANRLVRDFPAESAPKLELASLEMQQKSYTDAESMYRALYTADRKDVAALQGLVQSLYAENRSDAAIAMLREERAKNDSADIRAMLADAYLRNRKPDLAVDEYGRLAEASPNSSFFHLKLGDAYLQSGKTTEAITQFQNARKLAPNDAASNSMLALSLQQAGRAQEARQAYHDALALDPQNPLLMNNLANLIAENGGDLDDALQLAQGAARIRPADTDLADTLGWVYFKKNMNDDALRVLSDTVKKNPAQPVYRYHFALALVKKGDKAEAKRQLEAALASQPQPADEAKINELLPSTR